MLALEEATLSTDLQQGYALKSLTGRGSLLALPLDTLGIVWGLTFDSLGAEVDLFSLMLTTQRFLSSVFFPLWTGYIFEHPLSTDQFMSLSTCSMSGTKTALPCF